MTKLLTHAWNSFDRVTQYLTGISHRNLPDDILFEVETQQLVSVEKQRIIRCLSSLFCVSVTFAAVTYELAWSLSHALFPILTAVICLELFVLRPRDGWDGNTERPYPDVTPAVSLHCMQGLLWGLIGLVFMPVVSIEAQFMLSFVFVSILCIAPFSLLGYARSVLGYIAPMTICFVISVFREGAEPLRFTLPLIALYFVAMPTLLAASVDALVRQVVARGKVLRQKNLIGLLLNDFEDNSNDWLWRTDADLVITRASDVFRKLTGCKLDGASDERMNDLLLSNSGAEDSPSDKLPEVICRMQNREAFRELMVQQRIEGRELWWSLSGRPNFSSEGEFIGYQGFGRDVTERKKREDELSYLAHRDQLTGLHNRHSFDELLTEILNNAAKNGNNYALFVIDLDDFKGFNETAGHMVGNDVLRLVARRLCQALPDGAVTGRVGGDEFASILMIEPDTDPEQVFEIARDMVSKINAPIITSNGPHAVHASVGIALIPRDASTPKSAISLANMALKESKRAGRDQVRMSNAKSWAAHNYRRTLERNLETAVDRGELFLEFQPIVDAQTQQLTMFEGLLRWDHSTYGVVPPDDFIEIAEASGLIHQIGAWALNEGCRQAATWPEHIRVSVNISPIQLDRRDFCDLVYAALDFSDLSASRLELEITESAIVKGVDFLCEITSQLQQSGITIAMDDFGTGYSSLSMLHQVNFDKLKIDRSLVQTIGTSRRMEGMLPSIINLGKALNMQVTAEGVELEEQADLLRILGCDLLQGFHYGSPVAAPDLSDLIATWPVPMKRGQTTARRRVA